MSRVESNFFTPSTEIVTLFSDGVGGPQHSEIKDGSSLVNTDLNCLLRILALPSEWCTRESSIFSGAIPWVCLRIVLIYLQNFL